MLVRALAYILAYGPGIRQATEDAVLNANYIRKHLEGVFDLPYSLPSMHEVVFSDAIQKKNGVNTMDIAKRLIDYGFHPYTTAFPLIVPGALMIEPTESESKRRVRPVHRRDAVHRPRSRHQSRTGENRAAHHARRPPRRSRRRPQSNPALGSVAPTRRQEPVAGTSTPGRPNQRPSLPPLNRIVISGQQFISGHIQSRPSRPYDEL